MSRPDGVVILQVGFHLGDDLGVVGAFFIEPEDGGRVGGAGAIDGELHPVADRGVLGLAGAPDVAVFDGVFEENLAGVVDDADGAVAGDFEGLVVRAVFLGGLRHEADVRHAAHRAGIEGAVFFAEIDGGLVNAGVAAVGDDGEGVLLFALGVPHLAGGADHRGHGGIDDDVAGDVEVGDALVGVHHGDGGATGVGGLDVGLDLGLLLCREALDLCDEVAEAVVEVDAEFLDDGGVLGDEVLEEDFHSVAEDDRVGDLHHGGLKVEGEEDALLLRGGDLLFEEGDERLLVHDRGVDDFAGLEGSLLLEDLDGAVGRHELDSHVGGVGDGDGFLVGEEIVLAHGADIGLRVGGPLAHGVRVFSGVFLDGLRRTAVGVALAEDGVDGAALDLVVAGLGFLFGVGFRFRGIVGELVTLGLQLGDGRLQLGDRGADVGQLDDVRFGLGGQVSQFGEGVTDPLLFGEILREIGNDTSGEGDVARFDRDASMLRERLDDWQKGIGGESGRFVGLGVDDGRKLGHIRGLKFQPAIKG